ncbi:MAG: glycosyl hydrolase, partial [Bacteroidetes bacterium]|nr:glycosyl hydrolase [Bacteroidota bacterium]
MIFRILPLLFLLVLPASAQRQNLTPVMDTTVPSSSPQTREQAFATRISMFAASPLKNAAVRNVGPSIMSGRVTDIDADPRDPSHFMVAYASGGLWVTRNNGQSFDPIFDGNGTMTIGDIHVDWATGAIWVGTGENNSSRSSYAGDGVYRSTDWGASWQHMGLVDTQHTGRILVDPRNPDIVWVAALGALYSHNADRGVYRSMDGGQTWEKNLFVNERTGAVDLVMDPTDPDILYAAMWERDRRAWNFVESGAGSGIWKTTDGGQSWQPINGNGFPIGEGVGRIGLALHGGSPGILYATLDNQERMPADRDDAEEVGPTRAELRAMDSRAFLALDRKDIEAFLERENFPDRYDVETVVSMVERQEITPADLVDFVDDANSQLFETEVKGLEVYRSNDGGASWRRTHEEPLEGVYSSYGYYFGEIRVAPDNADQVYAMGVPIIRSDDGGATWKSIDAAHVHSDHQALWMNPNRPGHAINGNDGGLNLTWDAGETWSKLNVPPVGQFYFVQVDMAEPYNVYGGLQDNGTWMGPSTYQASPRWTASGQYPYRNLNGGDGFQVMVDTRTNDVVYTGSQFGFYSRANLTTGERASIRPRHELGEKPLRFNWQTPILLSPHNQDIFYYGANRLYRSMNRGEDLKPISPDLTGGGRPGDVPFGTLTTISESPLRFGLIYVGSDDGFIHVTRDGGVNWTRIDGGLPQGFWVSRVVASSHAEGRVYATLNGYRSDHFDAYAFVSEDFGNTWTRIGDDLPAEPVNVIIEHHENPELLFVGTDHAVYASLDRGQTFHGFAADLPFAAVHDLKIQTRENDLVIGTHGRSIWIADLAAVSALDDALLASTVHVFDGGSTNHSSRWGARRASWADVVVPQTEFMVWAGTAGSATVRIVDEDGNVLQSFEHALETGLNRVEYDFSMSEEAAAPMDEAPEPADNGVRYLPAGTFTVRVQMAGAESEASFMLRTPRGRGSEPAPAPDPV